MSKNKKQTAPVVAVGNVVATFMNEMTSMMQELKARRAFANEWQAFVKTKPGLVVEFENFRKTT